MFRDQNKSYNFVIRAHPNSSERVWIRGNERMKLQTLLDAMRTAEVARAELENAMVKFETAMAEMNKALADATLDRPNIRLVVSR